MSVTSIIGPPLMNNLFSCFTGEGAPVEFPGAPFLAGAINGCFQCLFKCKDIEEVRK